jgi:hypothetical protein
MKGGSRSAKPAISSQIGNEEIFECPMVIAVSVFLLLKRVPALHLVAAGEKWFPNRLISL